MAPHGTKWRRVLAETSASEHRERFRVAVPGLAPEPLQPAGLGMLCRGRADRGSIASSRTLAVAPIGLLCVGAPEQPCHATLGHETHRRPAALRSPLEPILVTTALLPELRDRTISPVERRAAFPTVLLVESRRTVVPHQGPPLVSRSRDLQAVRWWFERADPLFERGLAQVARDRAPLRGEAAPGDEDQSVSPKLYVKAVRRRCFMQLAPASSATKPFGTLALDPADQAFDAAESFGVRRAERQTLGMLAIIGRVRHLT